MAYTRPIHRPQLLSQQASQYCWGFTQLTFWPPSKPQPSFCLACNRPSVVSRLTANLPIDPTEPHADLLVAARSLMQSCGYQVELIFVRRHQDNGQPMVLTRDAWLPQR